MSKANSGEDDRITSRDNARASRRPLLPDLVEDTRDEAKCKSYLQAKVGFGRRRVRPERKSGKESNGYGFRETVKSKTLLSFWDAYQSLPRSTSKAIA